MRQASSHIERQGLKEKAAVSDDRGLFLSWQAARRHAVMAGDRDGTRQRPSWELADRGRWIVSLRWQ